MTTQPVATARLSGIPRTGTLVLPAPRPMYVVEGVRLPNDDMGGEYARLSFREGSNTYSSRLIMCHEFIDDDGVRVGKYWHGEAALDGGYQWRVRADENMRELQLFDDLKQRTRRWSYEAA